MEVFEIEDALQSMVILVDTREQPSERARKRYQAFSFPYERRKLDFGDYSAEFSVNGSVYQLNTAIERKMDLEELSACFTHERKRFKAEFERAKEKNASVFLLLEDSTWENLINGKYKTKFNKKAFFASLVAWIVRYNIKPILCKKETSGTIIQEILYRDLKERLERGEYG